MHSLSTPSKEPPTNNALLKTVTIRTTSSINKVTVVGVGMVGMACAFSILTQKISNDIALVDCAEDRLAGEMLDLQQGSQFINNAKIKASTDYSITAGSRLCIVTAGVRQREGESRLVLLQRNTDILKLIIPQLVKYSPNTIILMVTNPVDILTYVAWKISGLPKHKVIGSGTNLDSARFRLFLSQKLNIAPTSCHGWIIGEHGDSSVALWSGVNVAGVSIKQMNPAFGTTNDEENWSEIHQKVIDSGYTIIKLKGYTSWAIALSATELANAILNNTETVHAVSIHVTGLHEITQDVFLSLPVVLGENGVLSIVKQQLSNEERTSLQQSAKLLEAAQNKVLL